MASITTPVTVVAQPYDTSGNGGRKLVRLSNGWLVAGVYDPTNRTIYLYKSQDNGQTWSQLWYVDGSYVVSGFALASSGNTVHLLYTVETLNRVYHVKIDALNPPNNYTFFDGIMVDQNQNGFSGVSLAIAPDGTLHAAWASKNSTYPSSFNIRYAKGTINGDGSVTWGSVEQSTVTNSGTSNYQDPCIVIDNSNRPSIIIRYIAGANTYILNLAKHIGSSINPSHAGVGWGMQLIYSGGTYPQVSPCAVVDNAGVIHVVWHGLDSTDSTIANIRYAKSPDGGTTWSSATKLTSGNANGQSFPTITCDKNNKIYVIWQGVDPSVNGTYPQIRKVVFDGAWSPITTLTNNTNGSAVSASSLYQANFDFSDPLIIYKDSQVGAVKFRGTWTTNQNPTITLTSPGDNQTLSEGNQFLVEGSVSDVDYGDVITIKYKINNGTERALYSAVSDGSNPINFSKALIFSGDRLYDGAVDVSGSLAEGVNHTLSVWAVDNQGGQSVLLTRTFTVHHNQGAIITVDPYTPTQAGLIEPDMITLSGSAFDPDNNTITVTGKINNATEEVLLSAVTSGNWTFSFPVSSLKTGDNTITIKATDQFGKETLKTFKINKTEQKTPLLKSVARYKIIPPLGTAKEILAWLKREKGDLDVETEASFTDARQPETYVPAVKSSVDLSHDIAEDEFVVSVDTAKPEIVLKQTFTRTDTNSTQAATSLVGVIS
jgi:hypothetical protein